VNEVLKVRRETKGRGGKTVTRVSGLPLTGTALADFARELKQRCGTGGALEEGDLLIQGDQVERLLALLAAAGYRPKKAGG
jgi:translation initiation factor 1